MKLRSAATLQLKGASECLIVHLLFSIGELTRRWGTGEGGLGWRKCRYNRQHKHQYQEESSGGSVGRKSNLEAGNEFLAFGRVEMD